MTKYAREWADARKDVAEAGVPVSFSGLMSDDYDPWTDTDAPYTSTVTGVMIRKNGDPVRYQALGLIPSEAATGLFVPDTEGELPPLGASVLFADAEYAVRDVDPIGPDGVAIMAEIIMVGGGADRVPTNEHVADEASEVVGSETDEAIA